MKIIFRFYCKNKIKITWINGKNNSILTYLANIGASSSIPKPSSEFWGHGWPFWVRPLPGGLSECACVLSPWVAFLSAPVTRWPFWVRPRWPSWVHPRWPFWVRLVPSLFLFCPVRVSVSFERDPAVEVLYPVLGHENLTSPWAYQDGIMFQ